MIGRLQKIGADFYNDFRARSRELRKLCPSPNRRPAGGREGVSRRRRFSGSASARADGPGRSPTDVPSARDDRGGSGRRAAGGGHRRRGDRSSAWSRCWSSGSTCGASRISSTSRRSSPSRTSSRSGSRGERRRPGLARIPRLRPPPAGPVPDGPRPDGRRAPVPRPRRHLAWYRDTRVRGESDEALVAAQVALGHPGGGRAASRSMRSGRSRSDGRAGAVAALLLMINPLYRLHARRAIADVPCEALVAGGAGGRPVLPGERCSRVAGGWCAASSARSRRDASPAWRCWASSTGCSS